MKFRATLNIPASGLKTFFVNAPTTGSKKSSRVATVSVGRSKKFSDSRATENDLSKHTTAAVSVDVRVFAFA